MFVKMFCQDCGTWSSYKIFLCVNSSISLQIVCHAFAVTQGAAEWFSTRKGIFVAVQRTDIELLKVTLREAG